MRRGAARGVVGQPTSRGETAIPAQSGGERTFRTTKRSALGAHEGIFVSAPSFFRAEQWTDSTRPSDQATWGRMANGYGGRRDEPTPGALEPDRRALLSRAKLLALVRAHWGVGAFDDGPRPAMSGMVAKHGERGWMLVEDDAVRALGRGLLWSLKAGVREHVELMGDELDDHVGDRNRIIGQKRAEHPDRAPLHGPAQPVVRAALRRRQLAGGGVHPEEPLQIGGRRVVNEPPVAGDLNGGQVLKRDSETPYAARQPSTLATTALPQPGRPRPRGFAAGGTAHPAHRRIKAF